MAVGSDSNFCRVPMGSITAQTVADSFGACLTTRKLVDHIYQNADIKLAPVTYPPVGNNNELVSKFIEHQQAIEAGFAVAGGINGQLVGSTKKDVVISNLIVDPTRPDHVVIYGWHQLNGQPIQPLTNIHYDIYVDYSHGIRFIDADIILDGDTVKVQDVLQDEILYKVLSNEAGPMLNPTYLYGENISAKPGIFAVRAVNNHSIRITLQETGDTGHFLAYLSNDGINFAAPMKFSSTDTVFANLTMSQIVYVKLRTANSYAISQYSEVLATSLQTTDRERI